MGLNKSNGNMYTWITNTWNTVKGECPHGCSYCYMRRMGGKLPDGTWKPQPKLHFDEKELKTDLGNGKFIFIGSSCDMFANDIPAEWIARTLEHCFGYPGNRYLFQSKNPSRMCLYDGTLKRINAVACTTIETNRPYPEIMVKSPTPNDRAWAMAALTVPRYVTIEPILDFDLGDLINMIRWIRPAQVNIGADSGGNNLPEPGRDKILALIEALQEFTVIDQKRNLTRLLR